MRAGAGNGAPPADEAPKLLSAKPQLSRAPTRGGVRGGRGQQVDPNSIPAGGVRFAPSHARQRASCLHMSRLSHLTAQPHSSCLKSGNDGVTTGSWKAKVHPGVTHNVREAHCS